MDRDRLASVTIGKWLGTGSAQPRSRARRQRTLARPGAGASDTETVSRPLGWAEQASWKSCTREKGMLRLWPAATSMPPMSCGGGSWGFVGRPASECGRLRHGDRGRAGAAAARGG
jgi:hypothetical protein